MGQYFMFFNADKSQAFDQSSYAGSKLGEIFLNSNTTWFLSFFKHASDKCPLIQIDLRNKKMTKQNNKDGFKDSKIGHIPIEVIDIMFKSLDLTSRICLGLTCKNLWKIGTPHIRDGFIDLHIDWCGDRFFLTSDEQDPTDYPDSLQDLKERYDADTSVENIYYDVRRNNIKLVDGIVKVKNALADLEFRHKKLNTIDQHLLLQVIDWFKTNVAKHKPNQNLVLRNLDLKLYVTQEAVKRVNEAKMKPETSRFNRSPWGLTHVMLAKCAWVSHSFINMKNVTDMHRGKWAGHRFDIISKETLDKELEGGKMDDWMDFSSEISEELWKIFTGEGDEAELPPHVAQMRQFMERLTMGVPGLHIVSNGSIDFALGSYQ